MEREVSPTFPRTGRFRALVLRVKAAGSTERAGEVVVHIGRDIPSEEREQDTIGGQVLGVGGMLSISVRVGLLLGHHTPTRAAGGAGGQGPSAATPRARVIQRVQSIRHLPHSAKLLKVCNQHGEEGQSLSHSGTMLTM